MKHSLQELRKIYKSKLAAMETLFHIAKFEEEKSEQRKELVYQIAVMLRALFCDDRTGSSLIHSSKYESDIYFPMTSILEPYNELREFLLVSHSKAGGRVSFSSSFVFNGKIPTVLLSFDSWINEIVVDLKMKDYPPLTRLQIIKLVADKNGAHVDVNLDKYSALLRSSDLSQVRFVEGNVIYTMDCSDLLIESILTICEEVLYANKCLKKPVLCSPLESKYNLYLFDYTDNEKRKYKYAIFKPNINQYNTNHFYDCEMTKHPMKEYDLLMFGKFYKVAIIKVESLV